MNDLKKEELLDYLDKFWLLDHAPTSGWKQGGQAYQQIKALIKKPEVTEEWIKGKALEIYNLSYYSSFKPEQIADFIRSLIEDIHV